MFDYSTLDLQDPDVRASAIDHFARSENLDLGDPDVAAAVQAHFDTLTKGYDPRPWSEKAVESVRNIPKTAGNVAHGLADAAVYGVPAIAGRVKESVFDKNPMSKDDWADRAISRERSHYSSHALEKDDKGLALPPVKGGLPHGVTQGDVSEGIQSLPYTGLGMAGSAVGRVVGAAAGAAGGAVTTGNPAGVAAGTAIGKRIGSVAVSALAITPAAKNQIERELLYTLQDKLGRRPTESEAQALLDDFSIAIKTHTAGEVLPEAIGNSFELGFLWKMIGKTPAGRWILRSLAAKAGEAMKSLGVEIGTEAITGMIQQPEEVKMGLRPGEIPRNMTSMGDWGRTVQEVAPAVITQQGVVAGGATGLGMMRGAEKKSASSQPAPPASAPPASAPPAPAPPASTAPKTRQQIEAEAFDQELARYQAKIMGEPLPKPSSPAGPAPVTRMNPGYSDPTTPQVVGGEVPTLSADAQLDLLERDGIPINQSEKKTVIRRPEVPGQVVTEQRHPGKVVWTKTFKSQGNAQKILAKKVAAGEVQEGEYEVVPANGGFQIQSRGTMAGLVQADAGPGVGTTSVPEPQQDQLNSQGEQNGEEHEGQGNQEEVATQAAPASTQEIPPTGSEETTPAPSVRAEPSSPDRTMDNAGELATPGAGPLSDIDSAAHEAATSPHNDLPHPTDGQKAAGNYRKGHVSIHGLDISIENPKGSERSGKDKGGKEWKQTMAAHYGYFKGSVGKDKDHVDVFLGERSEDASRPVFVIDQVDPGTGKFDEHKVVMGAADEAEARSLYLSNYEKGWKGLGSIIGMGLEQFKDWVRDPNKTKKPAGKESTSPLPVENKTVEQRSEARKQELLAKAMDPNAEDIGDEARAELRLLNEGKIKTWEKKYGGHDPGISVSDLAKSERQPGLTSTGETQTLSQNRIAERLVALAQERDGAHLPFANAMKSARALIDVIEKGEYGDIVHPDNKLSRIIYQEVTGKKLPAGAKATQEFFAKREVRGAHPTTQEEDRGGRKPSGVVSLTDKEAAEGRRLERQKKDAMARGDGDAVDSIEEKMEERRKKIDARVAAEATQKQENKSGQTEAPSAEQAREQESTVKRSDTPPAGSSAKPAEKPATVATKPSGSSTYGADNKLVTQARADELRAKLRAKLGQVSMGVDPELLALGTELAVFHIEAGARSFVKFAKAMAVDLGAKAKPFLKAWYMGAKNWPGMDKSGMDAEATLDALDVDDFIDNDPDNADIIGKGKTNQTGESHERGGTASESQEALGQTLPAHGRGDEEEKHLRDADAERGEEGSTPDRATDEVRVSAPRSGRSRAPRGDSDSSGKTRKLGRRGRVASEPAQEFEPPNIPAANFVISDDVRLGKGGESDKFRDNITAIETLKRIEREQRRATPEEQKALARYVGWGGLANAFAHPTTRAIKAGWEDRVKQLADLLDEKELAAARNSTQNAHYTPPEVVKAIWDAVRQLGVQGGIALEPSAGVGNFIGLAPEDLRGVKFVGVEYDAITARIARALYPQSTIIHSGFQKVPVASNSFDLVIGNPPFGKESLTFRHNPAINQHSIHNQFFLAGIDALKPGGIQAMVVSRYLLDAKDSSARIALAKKAKLLGAIRLPDTAFKENARTEVVTDIIFLQKTTDDPDAKVFDASGKEEKRPPWVPPSWVETTTIPDPLGGEPMTVNRYFAENKNAIIGAMERSGSMQHGADITVRFDKGGDLATELASRIQTVLPSDVVWRHDAGEDIAKRFESMRTGLEIAMAGHEPGSISINEVGKLEHFFEKETFAGGLEMTRRELSPESPWSPQLSMDKNGKWFREVQKYDESGNKVKNGRHNVYEREVFDSEKDIPDSLRLRQAKFDRLVLLVRLRDILRDQINLETKDAPSATIEGNRKKLKTAYDAFVSEHGYISDGKNANLVSELPDGALILALEHGYKKAISAAQAKKTDSKPREASAKQAPILSSRVVFKPEMIDKASSPAEAILVSLSETGVVNLDRIAELLGVSKEKAIAQLHDDLDSPLIFPNPETGQWEQADEYLTGQVVKKLAAAKAAGLTKNVAALEKVRPERWGAEKVTPVIGAAWIGKEDYADFVTHLTGEPAKVEYSKITNSYSVHGNGKSASGVQWRTERADTVFLVEALLNSSSVNVFDYDSDGKRHLNLEQSELASMKAAEIESEFTDWAFRDSDRRNRLVDSFNEKFNTRVPRQRDGSHLTLPGKVPDIFIKMRRHQMNAVWRGIVDRYVLYDHAVGAGKTFTAIARAMERRRMGISRKPMIVVPNHLVEQFAADVYRLYPGANLLAATKKDFEMKNRRRLFAKIATGNWDMVIVPHSSFKAIGISQEAEERFLERDLELAKEAVKEAEEQAKEDGLDQGFRKPHTVKMAEKMVSTITEKMEKLKGKTRDRLLSFEQLGVDDLTMDEAHEFKNLWYNSRLSVRGMNPKLGSEKAYDLYNKVRVLRESPTGSVAFMTGTPISNSAVEMYGMMRYLAADELYDLGIDHFDAWRAQYTSVTSKFEPTESGNSLKEVKRLGRDWVNMRSLMDLYYSFTDAVTNDDIRKWYAEDNNGAEFPLPKVKGGARQSVVVQPTEAQQGELERIIAGFEALPDEKNPKIRNAQRLRLMDQARKVSLDVRAVSPRIQSDEKGGKLERVSDEVARIYRSWEKDKGTQLIFLDRSIPKSKGDAKILKEYDAIRASLEAGIRSGDDDAIRAAESKLEKYDQNEMEEMRRAQSGGWNAYQQIKENLVARGIPANEIRFIQEANTDDQKKTMFDMVNSGEVRVLIGSSPKMGAGTNVQERLVALHHVDVTWKPSDIEQREGRVIRQGNSLLDKYGNAFEVEIQAYVTERTIDAKLWDLNATKLRMINGIRKYDGEFTMEFDDEDSVGMAEIAALASGNPLQLERVTLAAEIDRLERAERAYRRQKYAHESELSDAKKAVATFPAMIAEGKEMQAVVSKAAGETAEKAKARQVVIDGKTYSFAEGREAFKVLLDQRDAAKLEGAPPFVAEVNGKAFKSYEKAEAEVSAALGDLNNPLSVMMDGKEYTERTGLAREIAKLVNAKILDIMDGEDATIAKYTMNGVEVTVEAGAEDSWASKDKRLGLQATARVNGKVADTEYITIGGESKAITSVQTRPLVNLVEEGIKKIQSGSEVAWRTKTLGESEKSIPALEEQIAKPFLKAEELAAKRDRLEAVIKELAGGGTSGGGVVSEIDGGKLINEAEGRELYSRSQLSTGTTAEQVAQELTAGKHAKAVKRLLDAGRLKIVQSMSALPFGAKLLNMTAWHGSPHTFDKFSTDKIGSGEGAQAYGYGLYFAGAREVAEWYRDKLSTRDTSSRQNNLLNFFKSLDAEERQEVENYLNLVRDYDLTLEEVIDDLDGQNYEDINQWWNDIVYSSTWGNRYKQTSVNRGKLYQVELAPQEDEYLLWDKPLSEQSEKVRAALSSDRRATNKHYGSGQEYYRGVTSRFAQDAPLHFSVEAGENWAQKSASEYLHSLGIRGIKYLDGSSRRTGLAWQEGLPDGWSYYKDQDGGVGIKNENGLKVTTDHRSEADAHRHLFGEKPNHNYVIFNDEDISVTAKYSQTNGQVGGAYDPTTDTMYLVADGIERGEAERVLLHEGLHRELERWRVGKGSLAGLDKLFAQLGTLDKLAENGRNAELAKWFERARRAARADKGTPQYLEEIAAYAVQHSDEAGTPGGIKRWVQQFLAKVKAYLMRTFGVHVGALDPAMFREIAVRGLADGRSGQQSGRGEQETEKTLTASLAQFSRAARAAGWTPSRLRREIAIAEFPGGNARAGVAWIEPQRFLDATTPDDGQSIKDEAKPLDVSRMRAETQTPFLQIEDGKIVGHEGRHRMAALAAAGVDRVPIVVDWHYPGASVESGFFSGQKFGTGHGRGVHLAITPLISANESKISEKMRFWTWEERGVQFSREHGITEAEAKRQYAEVEKRYKGTAQWMKAPNGQPTRLTERQWVQVRTPAFKAWFGDWETAAIGRLVAGMQAVALDGVPTLRDKQAVEAAFRGFESVENGIDGRMVTFPVDMAGKVTRHKGFDTKKIAGAFDRLFESSVRIDTEPVRQQEGRKDHSRNVAAYHHYVNRFQQEGKEYYVRFTVQQMSAKPGQVGANLAHSSFVSDVAIYEHQGVATGSASLRVIDPVLAEGATPVDYKLASWLAEVKAAAGNASQVVDANGEPMVVYKGMPQKDWRSGEDIHVIDSSNGPWAGFFSDHQAVADGFRRAFATMGPAVLHKVFLNIRHPHRVNAQGGKARTVMFDDGVFGKAPTNPTGLAAFKRGHDAVIISNTEDEGTIYVPKAPNQIKSATDNTGQFWAGTDDIRFSRRQPGQSIGTLTAEQETALRNIGGIVEPRTLSDRWAEAKPRLATKIAQNIADQYASLKELGPREYLLARMAKGQDGALEALMKFGGTMVLLDDVTDFRLQEGKRGVIESLQRLQGEQSRFFWWVAANRAERLKTEERENLFGDEDIEALKTLNEGEMSDGQSREDLYNDVLREYAATNKNVMDIAEQSGLIDGDMRAVWEHDMYVPFYRAIEDDVQGRRFAGGGLGRQYAFKQLAGGTRKLNNDLMANVLMNWSHVLTAAAKNRAATAILDTMERQGKAERIGAGHPTAAGKNSIYVMGRFEKILPAGAVYIEDGQQMVSDGTTPALVHGKIHYLVHDSLMLASLNGLEFKGFDGVAMKVLRKFKNALTIGVTANPAFKIRNLIRDSIAAIAQNELSPNALKNVGSGVLTMATKNQDYVSLLASGGLIRFGTMLEGNSAKRVHKLVNAGVKESSIIDTKEKMLDMLQTAVEWYNEMGDVSEGANRASLYKQMREQGKSHAEAAFAARDMLDFNLHGAGNAVRFLTQVVPFFNARVQGLYKLARAGKANPVRMSVVIGATALASIALLMAYKDDDDWKAREDWDRDNYWWFKIGGLAYRIPKPFEVGVAATFAERLAELMISDEMTGKRFAKRLWEMVAGTLSFNPVPQLVKPALDLYADKDSFTGRPIEGFDLENRRKEDRYRGNTSEFGKFVGKAADVTNLSPVQVDHLVRGYLGWIGTASLIASSYMARSITDRPERPAMKLKDVFLVGNFAETLPASSSRYVTQFYEQAREIQQAYRSVSAKIKEGDKAGAISIAQSEAGGVERLVVKNKMTNAYRKALTDLNNKIRSVENASGPGWTPEKKRKHLSVYEAKKAGLAKSFATRVAAFKR